MSSGVMLISLHAMPRAGLPGEHAARVSPLITSGVAGMSTFGRRRIDAAAGRAPRRDRSPDRKPGRRLDDDQRTVEPERQLPLVVQVRVVDERAGCAAA